MAKRRKRKNSNHPILKSWKQYKKRAKNGIEDVLLATVQDGDNYDDFDDYEDSVLDCRWDSILEENKQ